MTCSNNRKNIGKFTLLLAIKIVFLCVEIKDGTEILGNKRI